MINESASVGCACGRRVRCSPAEVSEGVAVEEQKIDSGSARDLQSAAHSRVHAHQHAHHVMPPSLSQSLPPHLFSFPSPNPLFSSLLFLLCVSPSRYFSSGSVVCFQEIRPLLISHMSRVELGKAQCVCLFIVCVCAVSHLCVCVYACACMRTCVYLCLCARVSLHSYACVQKESKCKSKSDSRFSPLAASVLRFFEALICPSSTTVWQSGKVTSTHCLTLLLLCKFRILEQVTDQQLFTQIL